MMKDEEYVIVSEKIKYSSQYVMNSNIFNHTSI